MCILICGLSNDIPTLDELNRACMSNPDGFGFSILFEDALGVRDIETQRSMSSSDLISSFLGSMTRHNGSVIAWMFHARIATHGAVNIDGCHPFAVDGSPRTMLGHNGVLPVRIGAGDWRSDSRVFAEDYISALGGARVLGTEVGFDVLDGFVSGSGSKCVILSAEDDHEPVTILGESLGHWRGDVWFSNRSYTQPASYRIMGAYSTFGALDDYETFEPVDVSMMRACVDADCDALVSDEWCDACGTCQECWLGSWDCQCDYSGAEGMQ